MVRVFCVSAGFVKPHFGFVKRIEYNPDDTALRNGGDINLCKLVKLCNGGVPVRNKLLPREKLEKRIAEISKYQRIVIALYEF